MMTTGQQLTLSSFYSFILQYLLGIWFVPITALGSWCRTMYKTNQVSARHAVYILWVIDNKQLKK